MKPEITDKRFYEKKWMSIGEWKNEKAPYLKKSADIEGQIALDWAKKYAKKGKVLDLGCGGGRNTILFSQNGFDSYGIDFSAKAIKLAKELNNEKKCSTIFDVQSVLDLKFDNEFFDLIMDFGCFHHLRKIQWVKYKKNVEKKLKPKGYFLIYCFSKKSSETGNYKQGKDYSYRNHHYNHYFSIEDLGQIFGKNFRILEHKIIKEEGRQLVFNIAIMQKLF